MMRNKYKPLSFSTTLRNPERIGDLLLAIVDFNNKIMTKKVCYDIYIELVQSQIVYPQQAVTTNDWNEKYSKGELTDNELDVILYDFDYKHKEAGFPAGKPSRVDTYYRLIKEFGFIYYDFNELIEITSAGHEYVKAYQNNDLLTIQKLFMNSLINFQTNSPLRANKCKNRPVALLFSVLQHLKTEYSIESIKKNELPLLICSKNNDYKKISELIVEFRKEDSDEAKKRSIYNYILSDLEAKDSYIKYEKIFVEAVDDYIRKFRFAGLIDLKGIYDISINKITSMILAKIVNLNDIFIETDDKRKFVRNMANYNEFINEIFIEIKPNADVVSSQWIDTFKSLNIDIDKEILNVINKKTRPIICIEELNILPKPLLLEFLYVIKLQLAFPYLTVKGNYRVDDTGLPVFYAPGGYPDIEIFSENNKNSIVEVTMLGGRNQVSQELLPITRHLVEFKKDNPNAFCWYISRVIHADVVRYSKFMKFDENLDIFLSNISESIEQINSSNNNYDQLQNIISEKTKDRAHVGYGMSCCN